MSSAEYQEIVRRMERIERLLAKLAGADLVGAPVTAAAELPTTATPEMTEADHVRAIQAEARYILDTQGMKAYKAFWKEQGKKRRPTLKKVA